MITLSPAKTGLKVTGGSKPLIVYPGSAQNAPDQVVLLSVPEEEPGSHVLSWPGEYNFGDITIRGVAHREGQQVSFTAMIDGFRLGFLSGPLQDWSDAQLESVGDVDVLVMPLGEAKVVQKLVDEFDPRVLVVVPGEEGDPNDPLLKQLGAKPESKVKEVKLKGNLPQEGREVWVLG